MKPDLCDDAFYAPSLERRGRVARKKVKAIVTEATLTPARLSDALLEQNWEMVRIAKERLEAAFK